MVFALHGTSALKILAILYANYHIAKCTHRMPIGVPATWIFNIAILFANELCNGYRFALLHPTFEPLVSRIGVDLKSVVLTIGCARIESKAFIPDGMLAST